MNKILGEKRISSLLIDREDGRYMKKKLALICMDPDTKRVLSDQLMTLLDDNVSIECYSLQEVTKQHIDAQAILISNYYLLPEIHKKFTWEDSAVVINARRSIGKKGIKALLAIPKGKRCLLYVGNRSLSHYIINLIKYLGINHIELIPEPDSSINYDFHTVDYIINAGKQALSKDVPAIVVDVGILQIDITTLLEVLFSLDLTNTLASIVSAKYAGEIIDLSKEVSLALEQVTQTSKILEVVLHSHLEGIVMLDEEGKILVCNATAETLFALPQANLVGQSFVKENGFPWDWTELQIVNDRVLRFKNFKLVVDTRPVEAPCGRLGTVLTFRDVIEIQRLEEMVSRDRALKGLEARFSFDNIIGNSKPLQTAIATSRKLAQVDATILIYGESGVGKELFAQAIHNVSKRNKGPFVGVNFSAVTETLMESELFGYEEGAFIGAKKGGRPGLFELAYGGTIFLDEIGDASPALQSRLLRVLQEKQLMRVGGTKIFPVDVRVIAATNKNLPDLVRKGLFREDLYYRLNVLPLNVPSLRERRQDIPLLMKHFFTVKGFYNDVTPEAWHVLTAYTWPGNIRQLINVVEYICCTVGLDEVVNTEKLPKDILIPVYKDPSQAEIYEAQPGDRLVFPQAEDNTECLLVLQKIESLLRSKRSIGRRSLAEAIEGMTEARVRSCLRTLGDIGYITVNVGRRGTAISAEGMRVLRKLKTDGKGDA